MKITIRTNKVKPTDTRGERVRAQAQFYDTTYGVQTYTVTVPWDYGYNEIDMYEHAARVAVRDVLATYAGPEVKMVRALPTGYVFETEV